MGRSSSLCACACAKCSGVSAALDSCACACVCMCQVFRRLGGPPQQLPAAAAACPARPCRVACFHTGPGPNVCVCACVCGYVVVQVVVDFRMLGSKNLKILFSGFLTRTVYFCKLELAEIHGSTVCLCTCAFVVCILSVSARVHVSLMGLQAGPGLRLYACKLRRWCAGAFRSGPGKTHNPKGICFTGFDVLPAVSGRRATSHD